MSRISRRVIRSTRIARFFIALLFLQAAFQETLQVSAPSDGIQRAIYYWLVSIAAFVVLWCFEIILSKCLQSEDPMPSAIEMPDDHQIVSHPHARPNHFSLMIHKPAEVAASSRLASAVRLAAPPPPPLPSPPPPQPPQKSIGIHTQGRRIPTEPGHPRNSYG